MKIFKLKNMNFKEIFKWSILFILIILVIIPLVYWGFNAELTKMQIFLKFWWLYLIVIGLSIFMKIKYNI